MPSGAAISEADKKARRIPGVKLTMRHNGFYEDRDVQGTEVHWTWLIAHWHWAADLELAREQRRRCQYSQP